LDGWQRLLVTAGLRSTASIGFDSFWNAEDARLTVDIDARYRSIGFQPLDVRPKVEDQDEYGVDQAATHELTLLIHPNNMTMSHEAPPDEAS